MENRIQEVAKIIGLKEKLSGRPKHFSGGMKRRLNIGCSILHHPELIIMNKPTIEIDPQQ